jgi:transcriptional regulator with XRE-family HTH domain
MDTATSSSVDSKEIQRISPLKSLGLQVKKFRRSAGLTQEELSERCDIFRTYLSRIESGDANPSAMVLLTLAKHLNVAVGDFFSE